MSAGEALHCAGCGRDRGLEPIAREGFLPCPDCRESMALLDCGPGVLHDCGRCGGQFVSHDGMRDLVERHDLLDAVGRKPVPPATADVRVRYVPCPACGSLMNRRNFGANSGVIVDVCAQHGTWFDPGELPRVLAFIEAGGLTRARQRLAEEETRAERPSRTSNPPASAASPPSLGIVGDVGQAVGGAALEAALDLVIGLFT